MDRVVRFIVEIKLHPRTGTGKPEHMRHQREGKETWSMRVNQKDWPVYDIREEERIVFVTQVLGHYEDR